MVMALLGAWARRTSLTCTCTTASPALRMSLHHLPHDSLEMTVAVAHRAADPITLCTRWRRHPACRAVTRSRHRAAPAPRLTQRGRGSPPWSPRCRSPTTGVGTAGRGVAEVEVGGGLPRPRRLKHGGVEWSGLVEDFHAHVQWVVVGVGGAEAGQPAGQSQPTCFAAGRRANSNRKHPWPPCTPPAPPARCRS